MRGTLEGVSHKTNLMIALGFEVKFEIMGPVKYKLFLNIVSQNSKR